MFSSDVISCSVSSSWEDDVVANVLVFEQQKKRGERGIEYVQSNECVTEFHSSLERTILTRKETEII